VPELAFTRVGHGEPLVLLHGIGSSRQTWDAVLPALAALFDVVAIDLSGFGDSEPFPAQVEPMPAALAGMVAALLDKLEISDPHLVGNSLGGWVAVETAKLRPVRSVTLLSPAGLWRGDAPLYCRVSLRLSRWLARHAERSLSHLVRYRLGRALILGQTHGHPMRLSTEYARSVIHVMGSGPGFEATLRATSTRRILGGRSIEAPVTVAFGSRDVLLLRHQSRHLDELPPTTRTALLDGCGHVPMSDNPAGVVEVIRNATSRSRTAMM
jgi:pimeloyl-ACP methyl ester carboxylesterase